MYYEMISNYMIPLENIAAIAAGLVYSDNMTEFYIRGKCNMRKKNLFNKICEYKAIIIFIIILILNILITL